jgi:hypothetical protein
MAALVAATNKTEVDRRLQGLAQAIMTLREQVDTLHAWRAPHQPDYITGLGYSAEQEVDLSALINVAKMWTDLIGAGGTISGPNGEMFEDLIVDVFGLGGMSGIVTEPPPA